MYTSLHVGILLEEFHVHRDDFPLIVPDSTLSN